MFVGKTIAFVGRVDRIEETSLMMKTHDGKYIYILFIRNYINLLFKYRFSNKNN